MTVSCHGKSPARGYHMNCPTFLLPQSNSSLQQLNCVKSEFIVLHAVLLSIRCHAVVPEGYYLKMPGQVAPCLRAEYKSGFAEAPSCTKCVNGATTLDVASVSEANCSVLLRSSYAVAMDGSAIKSTRVCPQRFVCPGGSATAAFDPHSPMQWRVPRCSNALMAHTRRTSAPHPPMNAVRAC